ncbi:MAG: polyprenyl synthetase family protein [Candidatus Heimdallarchaeota archaeon]|nr:polyprenyl synthetase family protein [Candidatus Heimdallarchaeota archaeon]MCK4876396.1 polyprenyl synthetase family protein [Candidatus Heimdallarchaeota archaeon]
MTQIDDDFSLDIENINSYLANLRNHSPYEDDINDLIDHILQRGGKRIRPLLCLLSFEMTSGKERNDMSYAAACALEVIHNASLLVDDIFDKDVFRRSEKAFYLKFSTFAALSLSYSMSSLALSLASQTNDIEVVEELINTLHTLSASLFLEQKFRSIGEKMTKEDALKLIDKKTSSLFEAASVIGTMLGKRGDKDKEDMKLFGKLYGRSFQLRDDILSLISTENELGKSGVWTDITNRIQTYIVIEAMELGNEEQKEILQDYYLQKKDISLSFIKKAISDSGAVDSIKQLIKDYTDEAKAILNKYPSSVAREKLIEITDYLIIL